MKKEQKELEKNILFFEEEVGSDYSDIDSE